MPDIIQEVGVEDFKGEVLEHSGLVLVDFYAPWCGPCKKVSEILHKITTSFQGVKIVKVNIEEAQQIASNFMVMSVPALILFKAGRPQEKVVGLVSEREITKMISRHLV